MAASSLKFTVRRRQPELVVPAIPTPHEFKQLSDIDDQEGLRFQIPVIQFYRHDQKTLMSGGRDPCRVIRDALSRTLVYYYPFAGRLREGPNRKLSVECTGEGVLFIEADADVELDQFGEMLQPPFPQLEDLLYDVPGSGGVVDAPLLLIQVTRLLCGGFIFALRLNHTMSDAAGLVQFMNAVAETARNRDPSVLPVWERERLNARTPPRVSCVHREYEDQRQHHQPEGTTSSSAALNLIPLDDMAHRSFFFGREHMASMRSRIPPHLRNSCSAFDILTASLWRCRTIALSPHPDQEMRVICITDARSRFHPPLPKGYYGNGFAFPAAVSTAGRLCGRPLGYAVGLVKAAKGAVTEEYMRSVSDLMVVKGRPHFTVVGTYLVSDLTRAGFMEVDFGWGKPGEKGIVVPVCLPGPAMERFVAEIESLMKTSNNIEEEEEEEEEEKPSNGSLYSDPQLIRSAL
ncbi:hypothetical protein H6P81_005825 [Aristolochia fimbriata]|uniref:Benzyl alcohol O-benzoyltransferase n=1 Tax=Aristolochia fimbriata TaxID=158543 RepID=A0AAV7EYD1_ARIFI|nr:hypothetical protein H6P81_005825 [Aristolochia fimbriata]